MINKIYQIDYNLVSFLSRKNDSTFVKKLTKVNFYLKNSSGTSSWFVLILLIIEILWQKFLNLQNHWSAIVLIVKILLLKGFYWNEITYSFNNFNNDNIIKL